MKLLSLLFASKPVGPWENDHVTAGCAKATYQGQLYVYTVPGVGGEEFSISVRPAVSPNFTPRAELLSGVITVFYTPDDSTFQDIIDLLEAEDFSVKPYFPDWLLNQTVPEYFDITPVAFADGTTTARVAVGKLYYTPEGTVKRRMA